MREARLSANGRARFECLVARRIVHVLAAAGDQHRRQPASAQGRALTAATSYTPLAPVLRRNSLAACGSNFASVDSITRKNLSELAIEKRSTLNTG